MLQVSDFRDIRSQYWVFSDPAFALCTMDRLFGVTCVNQVMLSFLGKVMSAMAELTIPDDMQDQFQNIQHLFCAIDFNIKILLEPATFRPLPVLTQTPHPYIAV